ncbi:MAG TPA: DUF4416 family protein, partial [Gemmataceae bacterium]
MAKSRLSDPPLLVVAAFSRHLAAIEWAQSKLEHFFGPIGLLSLPFDFVQTAYYEPAMGKDLRKWFFAFENLVQPDCLAAAKIQTN